MILLQLHSVNTISKIYIDYKDDNKDQVCSVQYKLCDAHVYQYNQDKKKQKKEKSCSQRLQIR